MKTVFSRRMFLVGFFALIALPSKAQVLQDWGTYENVKVKAIQRIEKHRKGEVLLKISLPNQQQLVNTQISVKLKRHDFSGELWLARVLTPPLIQTSTKRIF